MRYSCVAVAAVLLLGVTVGAQAQVIVHCTNGTTTLGERVVPEGDNAYKLEVYRGFSQQIPKAVVRKIEEIPGMEGGPPRAAARAAKASLSAGEKDELDRLLVSYFDLAGKPEEREKTLAALKQRDTLPTNEMAGLVRRAFELARKGPKLAIGTSKFSHSGLTADVHVEVEPKGQAPGKGLPLFLALHGGGENDGNWNSGTGMFIAPARAVWKQGVFICPTVLRRKYAEWGRNPLEEEYVKEVLKAAKRTWDIDTDRIYVGGHSMGGYGAWHFAGHQADVFGGFAAAAGGILTGRSVGETWGWGVIGNLRHSRVAFIHGTRDGPSPVWSDQVANGILNELEKGCPSNYVHRYVEIANGDHMSPVGKVSENVQWVLQHVRNPDPRDLTWEPMRTFVKHFFWLYVEKPRMFQRIEAAIKGNDIEIHATRINRGFSVLLNDRLVDLAKPVTVRVNGVESFRGMAQPSVTAILQSIDDKLDEKLVYTARIDF